MGLAEEKTKKYLDKIKKENGKYNAFLHVNDNALEDARKIDEKVKKTSKKGRLYGQVIGVKSNINVKGMICNCASKVLDNYVSGYDATVIEKIRAEDGVIIGMLNMDEFALGGSGENSAFGCAVNPAAPDRVPGGTSSGSAVAVAAGLCDISLGSDTGGSCRNPGSHCGIVGIKPSYGLVSRYGLIDSSMSLDQVGVLAKNVEDGALLLDVIKGKDERDTTTTTEGSRSPILLQDLKKLKVGVLRIKDVDKKIQKIIDSKVDEAKKKFGWEVKEVDIEKIDLAVETYYILQYSEFFSATRRFDGRRYGHKIEEYCGKEVLRRILGGSEITKAEHAGDYYKKALAVKDLIKEEFESAFSKFDVIILPTCPGLPWKVGQGDKMKVEEVYAFDACTIPANLAGICAISVPAGKIDDIPVGLQIYGGNGQESRMLSAARMIEKL